jgi:hypothetical protein
MDGIHRRKPAAISVTLGPVRQQSRFQRLRRKAVVLMAFDLGDDQEFDLTVGEVDARGNPVDVAPGSITFASSDETLLTVTPDATDGSLAVVAAVGPVGSASVTATSTDGLSGSLDVNIVTEAAVGLSLTPSNVREQS